MARSHTPSRVLFLLLAAALVTGLVAVNLAVVPDAGAAGTVEFCMAKPDGTWRHGKVGASAVHRLVEQPGGGLVGDPVPGSPGLVFGPDCTPQEAAGGPKAEPPTTEPTVPTTTTTTTTTLPPGPAVLARAWTVDSAGSDVLIAWFEDTNRDDVPSAGDTVRASQYPLGFAAATFGSFGVTAHAVAGATLGTSGDGAFELRAWADCGDSQCWFIWGTFSDGARGYERYSEYRLPPDGIATGNTGLHDGHDLECGDVCIDELLSFDVISIRPSSPSDPAHLLYDGVVSTADDPFLEVRVG